MAELPKAGFTEKVVPPKYIPPEINAKAAMIIDASDGDIIYQYNENEAFAPASMSKMMTAFSKSIHNGKVRWEDPVKMSAKAHKQRERESQYKLMQLRQLLKIYIMH